MLKNFSFVIFQAPPTLQNGLHLLLVATPNKLDASFLALTVAVYLPA